MQPAIRNSEPETRRMQTSLDRCLVDGDKAGASNSRRLRRKALGISFALETAALTLLIIAPLLTSVAQPNFSNTAFVPFVFSSAHAQHPAEHTSNPTHIRLNNVSKGIAYTVGIRPVPPPMTEEPDNAIPSGELLLGPVGPEALPVVGVRAPGPPEPPRDEIKKSVEKGPLRLSEPVVEAQLISRIEPRYPALALQTRLQGAVRLQAIISRDGRITSLEVLSGHPLLVQAALDAVRQWRYRPTLLHGEPVEVETSITVNFRMEP
jgi:protein TonB